MLDCFDGAAEDGGSHFPVRVLEGVSNVGEGVVEGGGVVKNGEHFICRGDCLE